MYVSCVVLLLRHLFFSPHKIGKIRMLSGTQVYRSCLTAALYQELSTCTLYAQ